RAEQNPKVKTRKKEHERVKSNVPAKSSQEKSGRGPKNPVVTPPPSVTIDPNSGAVNPPPRQPTLTADPNHPALVTCTQKLNACLDENASLNSQLQTLQGQIQQLQTQVQNLSKAPTCNGRFWNHPVYGTIDCSPYACRRDRQGCYSNCITV